MVQKEARLIIQPEDYGLNPREIDLVRSHAAVLKAGLTDITERYYAHHEKITPDHNIPPALVTRLKSARIEHWRLLLDGDLLAVQSDYLGVLGRLFAEAAIHHRVFPLAACWFAVEFGRLIDRSPTIPRTLRRELSATLTRFAFFDLAIAEATYDITFLD